MGRRQHRTARMLEIRNVDVQLWRLVEGPEEGWPPIVYLAAADQTYLKIGAQLRAAVDRFPVVSVLIRCRPPDSSTQRSIRELLDQSPWQRKVHVWLETLKLRCGAPSSTLSIGAEGVELRLDDAGLAWFLANCREQAKPGFGRTTGMHEILGRGPGVPELRFSPDWLGIE